MVRGHIHNRPRWSDRCRCPKACSCGLSRQCSEVPCRAAIAPKLSQILSANAALGVMPRPSLLTVP